MSCDLAEKTRLFTYNPQGGFKLASSARSLFPNPCFCPSPILETNQNQLPLTGAPHIAHWHPLLHLGPRRLWLENHRCVQVPCQERLLSFSSCRRRVVHLSWALGRRRGGAGGGRPSGPHRSPARPFAWVPVCHPRSSLPVLAYFSCLSGILSSLSYESFHSSKISPVRVKDRNIRAKIRNLEI